MQREELSMGGGFRASVLDRIVASLPVSEDMALPRLLGVGLG